MGKDNGKSRDSGNSKHKPKALASIAGGIDRPDIPKETMGQLFDSATGVALHQSHYGNPDTKIQHDPKLPPVFGATTPVPQSKPGKKC